MGLVRMSLVRMGLAHKRKPFTGGKTALISAYSAPIPIVARGQQARIRPFVGQRYRCADAALWLRRG
jgi:hypothetical protein